MVDIIYGSQQGGDAAILVMGSNEFFPPPQMVHTLMWSLKLQEEEKHNQYSTNTIKYLLWGCQMVSSSMTGL